MLVEILCKKNLKSLIDEYLSVEKLVKPEEIEKKQYLKMMNFFQRKRFAAAGLQRQRCERVSGGPLLIPTLTDKGLIWRFAGLIVQAAMGEMFEQVVAVRSQYVQLDGRIG